jgi:predicted nucleic acid-binding protein
VIVVDTNVIAYLFIKGDYTAFAEKLLKSDPEWISSPLWLSEFRSVLTLYIRKKKMTIKDATHIVQLAADFMDGREFHIDSEKIFRLVQTSNCSSYDCEFVALAQSLNLKLYTSDVQIVKEFPDTAILLKNIEDKRGFLGGIDTDIIRDEDRD